MSRHCKAVAVLFVVAVGAFLWPARAQTRISPNAVSFVEEEVQPKKGDNDTDRRADGNAIIRMLQVQIETKGLQDKVKLKTALVAA